MRQARNTRAGCLEAETHVSIDHHSSCRSAMISRCTEPRERTMNWGAMQQEENLESRLEISKEARNLNRRNGYDVFRPAQPIVRAAQSIQFASLPVLKEGRSTPYADRVVRHHWGDDCV